MPEEIKELLHEYQEGRITRRDFIVRAAVITGSLAAANALLDSLLTQPVHAAQVDPDDPDLATENVEYPGKAGPVSAYLARPKAQGKYPAIIVIHENRGINDHIRDIARRFAKEGYVALAPDFLSRRGGTAKVNPTGEGLRNIRELAPERAVIEDSDAGFSYLRGRPEVSGVRLGITGFCWGGGMAFAAAAEIRGLRAVVVYYGTGPSPPERLRNIEAPVLAHYGGEDPRVNAGIPATEEAMKKYGKSFTYQIYPGAPHAFNNDTNPRTYHPEAAREAWRRTIDFFNKELKS